MATTERGHVLDLVFLVGVALKALDAVLELAAGLVLLFVTPEGLASLTRRLTAGELLRDPHDLLANLLVTGVAKLHPDDLRLLAIYFLVHGIVKAAIVIALVVGAVRVYPWAIGALSLLTLLQIVELARHPSIGLVVLTVLDVVIIALTWREWRQHRGLRETLASTRAWLRSLRHR